MEKPLTNDALRAIRRILRAADLGGRKLAVATGLTPSQLLVLQQVARGGETTPSVIASVLQFGQATVTNIVDRLVEEELMARRRSERDKRQVLLSATDRGRALLDEAPDLLQERFRARFEKIPPWEQAMMLASLERLAHILDAGAIDAAPLLDGGVIDRSVR